MRRWQRIHAARSMSIRNTLPLLPFLFYSRMTMDTHQDSILLPCFSCFFHCKLTLDSSSDFFLFLFPLDFKTRTHVPSLVSSLFTFERSTIRPRCARMRDDCLGSSRYVSTVLLPFRAVKRKKTGCLALGAWLSGRVVCLTKQKEYWFR